MGQKLTAKEELFCKHYIKSLNKSKAAAAAGYSKKTSRQIGYELFTKPYIASRIEEMRQEIKEELGIDDHTIIKELASFSLWNIKDFIGAGNEIKDLSKMPKNKLKPVVGIRTRTTYTTSGKITTKEVTTELKMIDKRGAIVDLGRHLGIFEKDNKQSAAKIKVTRT